jgi:hypothetical protein
VEGQLPFRIAARSKNSLLVKVKPKGDPSQADFSKVQSQATMFFAEDHSGIFEATFWIEGSVLKTP